MTKKWYEYFVSVENPGGEPGTVPATDAAQSIAQIAATVAPTPVVQFSKPISQLTTFEDIYAAADIKPPANGYSIMKIHDMLSSEHIKQMPAEVKRGSIMVALDAAGVKIQEVIQDALRRDRRSMALNASGRSPWKISKPASWKTMARSRPTWTSMSPTRRRSSRRTSTRSPNRRMTFTPGACRSNKRNKRSPIA